SEIRGQKSEARKGNRDGKNAGRFKSLPHICPDKIGKSSDFGLWPPRIGSAALSALGALKVQAAVRRGHGAGF
ncbi:MAG: hypothetical protein ABIG11_08750, partial [bacterium]